MRRASSAADRWVSVILHLPTQVEDLTSPETIYWIEMSLRIKTEISDRKRKVRVIDLPSLLEELHP